MMRNKCKDCSYFDDNVLVNFCELCLKKQQLASNLMEEFGERVYEIASDFFDKAQPEPKVEVYTRRLGCRDLDSCIREFDSALSRKELEYEPEDVEEAKRIRIQRLTIRDLLHSFNHLPVYEGCDDLSFSTEYQPKFDSKDAWWTVKEGNPTQSGMYLVTRVDGAGREYVEECFYDLLYWFEKPNFNYKADNVIAYQPMPQPYRRPATKQE